VLRFKPHFNYLPFPCTCLLDVKSEKCIVQTFLPYTLVILVVFRLISDELSVIKVHVMLFKLILMRNSRSDRGMNGRREERKPQNELLTLFES
jgi:hypothetical protein